MGGWIIGWCCRFSNLTQLTIGSQKSRHPMKLLLPWEVSQSVWQRFRVLDGQHPPPPYSQPQTKWQVWNSWFMLTRFLVVATMLLMVLDKKRNDWDAGFQVKQYENCTWRLPLPSLCFPVLSWKQNVERTMPCQEIINAATHFIVLKPMNSQLISLSANEINSLSYNDIY